MGVPHRHVQAVGAAAVRWSLGGKPSQHTTSVARDHPKQTQR